VTSLNGFGRGREEYERPACGQLEASKQNASFGAKAPFDWFATAIMILLIENIAEHYDAFAGNTVGRSWG